MTTEQLIVYYANLLILQYIGQSNAFATIEAIVTGVIMNQLPLSVQNAFNMDGTAIGAQLDVLGKYAGVTRNGHGISGVAITLDDTDFFQLIKIAIITNSEGSDLNTIQNLLNEFFPGEIFLFDHKDMRLSYLIPTSVGSLPLIEMFLTQHLLPKPMGVQLSAPIYTSPLIFFGMVDAVDVAGYATQNSLSINTAANDVMSINDITPFNDSTNPTTTVWLNAELGIAI